MAGDRLSPHCLSGEETGIQTGANRVRGFVPKGETPVIRLVAKQSHVSMISTINNQGKVRFMMYRDAMNSELLIKFMTRLTKDAGCKVFLTLDNLRVHHGKEVSEPPPSKLGGGSLY